MNRNLTIVITMAGIGSRFKQAGYKEPKYQIVANGKTLFEWSMDSLLDYNKYTEKYIFIVQKKDNAVDFVKSKCFEREINSIEVVEIDYMTDGQATTCMLAIPYCNINSSLMVYNIDTYVEPYEMKYADLKGEGHIPCFHADGNHWSFVRLDEENRVAEVREKERISDNCSLGAYYFSSVNLYKSLYNEYYSDGFHFENKEKYIAPLYNLMIKKGMHVSISIINNSKVHVMGTPEELYKFIEISY